MLIPLAGTQPSVSVLCVSPGHLLPLPVLPRSRPSILYALLQPHPGSSDLWFSIFRSYVFPKPYIYLYFKQWVGPLTLQDGV